MHLRRIACLLLGAWVGGTILMGWVATANFSAADRVLASPPAQIRLAMSGVDQGRERMVLRYLVAIENGSYFLNWEIAEFVLLLAVAAVLMGDYHTRLLAIVPAVLLMFVAFQHFRVTPEIIWLGQTIVLAGGSASAQQRGAFGVMHRTYGIIEILKLLTGVVLSGWLISAKRRMRRYRTEEIAEKFDRRYAS